MSDKHSSLCEWCNEHPAVFFDGWFDLCPSCARTMRRHETNTNIRPIHKYRAADYFVAEYVED